MGKRCLLHGKRGFSIYGSLAMQAWRNHHKEPGHGDFGHDKSANADFEHFLAAAGLAKAGRAEQGTPASGTAEAYVGVDGIRKP
jgi:hypothetical protein